MLSGLLAYLPWLLLTLVVEVLLVRMLLRRQEHAVQVRGLRACIALNLVTHPLATLLLWNFWHEFLSLEALVLLGEMLGYRLLVPLPPGRAFLLATVANVCTGLLSLVATALAM